MKIEVEYGEIIVTTCATRTPLSLSDALLLRLALNKAIDWKWENLSLDENFPKEKEPK